MKKQLWIALLGVLFSVILLTTSVYAQSGDEFNPDTVTAGFKNLSFWIALAVTLVSGAIGGVVYELLILEGRFEIPHKPDDNEPIDKPAHAIGKYMYDLGVIARIIIGGLAAVAAMLVLTPTSAFGLMATAVIAGSAGTSIFRSLQDRLLAAVALKDASDSKDAVNKQSFKIEEALQAVATLKQNAAESAPSDTFTNEAYLERATSRSVQLDELNKIERILS